MKQLPGEDAARQAPHAWPHAVGQALTTDPQGSLPQGGGIGIGMAPPSAVPAFWGCQARAAGVANNAPAQNGVTAGALLASPWRAVWTSDQAEGQDRRAWFTPGAVGASRWLMEIGVNLLMKHH